MLFLLWVISNEKKTDVVTLQSECTKKRIKAMNT